MSKQVDKIAYRFEHYCGLDRWSSYHYQLRELLALSPKSVLEVGKGDGVIGHYLSANTDVSYRSLDIAEDLMPDIVGEIEHIPLPDASVDIAAAFEVLEHLPFERFTSGLRELGRVAKDKVIISLPHYGPSLRISFKLPFLVEKKFAWKIPHHPTHTFNGEHYWEIGKKGYELGVVRNAIENEFVIEKEFVPFENQYHHFFILRKKT
jgi:hypothetical protein